MTSLISSSKKGTFLKGSSEVVQMFYYLNQFNLIQNDSKSNIMDSKQKGTETLFFAHVLTLGLFFTYIDYNDCKTSVKYNQTRLYQSSRERQ